VQDGVTSEHSSLGPQHTYMYDETDALSALVNTLLREGGSDPVELGDNEEGEEGEDGEDSPLLDAARHGRSDEVRTLLAAGDAIDQTTADGSGSTSLILASEDGHTETVSVLCSAGAAVNLANSDGDTAMLLASEEGHTDVVSVLCAAGAAVDQADRIGRSPLFLAIDNGHLSTVQLLSSYGASRTATVMGDERTALGMATRRGHAEVAAWLTTSEQWATPLHHLSVIDAARARAELRGGASLDAAVLGGPTPLSLAREMMLLAATGSAAADLVLQAARPWSPDTHALFPAAARALAAALLITGHLLSRGQLVAEGPGGPGALLDVWVGWVMPHAVRRDEA